METHELLVTRSLMRPVLAWCSQCGCEAVMDSPETAVGIAGVSVRTVYRWVEAGKIHFAETPVGSVLVCINSLPRA